ncbi:MAG: helix-turn-helix domain-containing protein [Verrucomicrobia bacterium]|nr:helix-turn-helix domain-containing protein [Verrucomicrobiota bacterium]
MSNAVSSSALADAPTTSKPLFEDPQSRLLSSAELGQFIGKSGRTIERMVKAKKIPAYFINGSYRFSLGDVRRALERFKIKEVAL